MRKEPDMGPKEGLQGTERGLGAWAGVGVGEKQEQT